VDFAVNFKLGKGISKW